MGFSGESLESPGHGFRNSLEGSSGDSGAIHWEILGGNTVSHVASIVVRSVREYGAGGSSEADPPSGHSSLSTHKSNQFEANTSLLLLRPSFFTYLPRFWSPSPPPPSRFSHFSSSFHSLCSCLLPLFGDSLIFFKILAQFLPRRALWGGLRFLMILTCLPSLLRFSFLTISPSSLGFFWYSLEFFSAPGLEYWNNHSTQFLSLSFSHWSLNIILKSFSLDSCMFSEFLGSLWCFLRFLDAFRFLPRDSLKWFGILQIFGFALLGYL